VSGKVGIGNATQPPLPGGERVGVRGLHRVGNARRLRRDLTDAERKLWYQLRDRRLAGLKFKRQVPIGRFVADFACLEHHLIIEVDGGQHALAEREDAGRTAVLESMGFVVLRFWNNDVLTNIAGVADAILAQLHLDGPEPPHPSPLPSGERGRVSSGKDGV
jgi:very-short-patch-repair endonuclease